MRLRAIVACVIILVSVTRVAVAQAASVAGATALSALPETYTKDEFPDWLNDLRRFEIISLGVFPIVLFYTRLTMDITRYAQNEFSPVYAPWPFKNENSYAPSDDEQFKSILVAGGLSLAFGAIDAFLLWKISLE